MGMNIVIYLAAITSIDPSLYEAAEVDERAISRRCGGSPSRASAR